MARVAFEDVGKVYPGGARAVSRLRPRRRGRRVHGAGRPLGLRQDHRPAHGRRASRHITEGTIRIGDRVVNHVPAKDRDIAMVFQSYALYPHLKVYDNIAFGLRLRKEPKAEIDAPGARGGRDPRPHRVPRPPPGRALRRPAPARGDGQGDRAPAAGLPDGRAALEPRREAAGADAGPDQPAPVDLGRHDDLRHPRPGRGHDHGRPGGGDAQGPAPAGRLAAGGLRPPGQPVRGRLHRQPVDEHPRGRDRGDRGRGSARSSATGAWRSGPGSWRSARGSGSTRARTWCWASAPRASRTPPSRPGAPEPTGACAARWQLREALGSEIVAHVRVPGAVPAVTDDVVELARPSGPRRAAPGSDRGRRRRAGGAAAARARRPRRATTSSWRSTPTRSTSSTRARGSRSTTNDRDMGRCTMKGARRVRRRSPLWLLALSWWRC